MDKKYLDLKVNDYILLSFSDINYLLVFKIIYPRNKC